jgi:5-methylcytosine-specific restriction protein A
LRARLSLPFGFHGTLPHEHLLQACVHRSNAPAPLWPPKLDGGPEQTPHASARRKTMALSDLTNPDAIISALREFDALGRQRFLRKYGFGRAREYMLVHDGKNYDSKAICGAAHGFQYPSQGPLRAEDFSGGEQTVERRLEALGFTVLRSDAVPSVERNPDWNRDELILALDAYVRWVGNPPSKSSSEIADLSRLMNDVQRVIGGKGDSTLRNVNGVYMKLMNFRRLDPAFSDTGRVGLVRGGHLEEEVWNEFYGDLARLTAVATAIRTGINELLESGQTIPSPTPDEESDEDMETSEGRILSALHCRRERSRKIVQKKKLRELKTHGRLACECCGFDFSERYPGRGAGFIECHHDKPVSAIQPCDTTKLSDLRLVCANCHRMIHRRPWLTVAQLRSSLA